METGAITQYIDVAQLVLYVFWAFLILSPVMARRLLTMYIIFLGLFPDHVIL